MKFLLCKISLIVAFHIYKKRTSILFKIISNFLFKGYPIKPSVGSIWLYVTKNNRLLEPIISASLKACNLLTKKKSISDFYKECNVMTETSNTTESV